MNEILATLMSCLDEDHAHAIIEHRKAKRSKLTVFAAKLLARQFSLCDDPNAAAEEMIIRGWTGFKAEWINRRNATAPTTGHGMLDSLLRLQ